MPIEEFFHSGARQRWSPDDRAWQGVGGEEVESWASVRPADVVTGVEMFRSIDEGMAGDNAGLLLRGIAKEDVERGMVLAKGGSITPTPNSRPSLHSDEEEGGGIRHSSRDIVRSFICARRNVTLAWSCRRAPRW